MARSFPVGSFQGLRTAGGNLLAGVRDDGTQIEAALYEAPRAMLLSESPESQSSGTPILMFYLRISVSRMV